MKKIFFSLVVTKIFVFIGCNAVIVDSNGIVLPEVVAIFRHYRPLIEEKMLILSQKYGLSQQNLHSILCPNTDLSTISLSSLNNIAQSIFLRPAGSERDEIAGPNNKFASYTNEDVMNLFRKIGDIDDIHPVQKYYRYILINGSTVEDMRYMIYSLVSFIESNKIKMTPSTEIVFLTGERDLFDTEDEEKLLNSSPLPLNPHWKQPKLLPQTEDQAAEWIWNQSKLPDIVRNSKITFVRAQKKDIIDQSGNLIKIRPTTYDTIKTWNDLEKPTPGNCLAISLQPYVYYQQATIYGYFKKMNLLEKGFSIECIGTKDKAISNFDSFKNNIPLVLDNFARTIYTEVNNAK